MTEIETLEALFPLDDPDSDEFDAAVASVSRVAAAEDIPRIYRLIDDACPYSGLMASLLGSLATHEPEQLVHAFVTHGAAFRASSPSFYGEHLRSLVLARPHRELLAQALKGACVEERDAVRGVLSKIVRGAKQKLAATAFLNLLGEHS